ncbi:hypothetical protein K1719_000306 [Acacia pycnantha]|nr:hypothetical protein K1719_000306 [Acacia pycnantha]
MKPIPKLGAIGENRRVTEAVEEVGNNQDSDGRLGNMQDVWCVVQKQRRQRKGSREVPAGHRRPKESGSRFNVLLGEEKGVGGDKMELVTSAGSLGEAEEGVVHYFNAGQQFKERRSEKKLKNGKNQIVGGGLRGKAGNSQGLKQVKRPRDMDRSEAKSQDLTCTSNGVENEGREKELVGGKQNDVLAGEQERGQQFQVGQVSSNPLNPGDQRMGVPLAGKFWAGSSSLDPDEADFNEEDEASFNENMKYFASCSVCLYWSQVLSSDSCRKTKSEEDSHFRCLERLGYDGLSFVPRVGRSGGLVAVWKSNLISINVLKTDRQFIHMSCKLRGIESFLLTVVYVVPYESLKFSLWQDLQRLADHISIPWVVMVDFNDILMSDERVGGADINLGRLRKFQDRVQGYQLNDLGFSGPKFTWRGPRTSNYSRLYERLDRALANAHFLAAAFDCFIQ